METEQFDYVIIGGGLSGLMCGFIMSQEGYSVCVLEKNRQIGGNLQTFVRDRVLFDTGVHYIGGLDEGQPLYQFFKYFKLIGNIKLKRLDENGFDLLYIGKDPKPYRYGMGYENFKKILKEDFPEDAEAIDSYCETLQRICACFPMYNVEEGSDILFGEDILYINAKQYFEKLTPNEKLQNVLAGTNLLYAGDPDTTPLYVHALVVNSYIESSYRLIDGSSQIASVLTKHIRQKGGKILSNAEVVQLKMNGEDSEVEAAVTKDGRMVKGKQFIASMHPALLMEMLQTEKIRKAYRNRIVGLENTASVFIVNVVMKKKSFPYINYNIYSFSNDNVWDSIACKQENWPCSFAFYVAASEKDKEYADAVSIMSYMLLEDVKKWEHTFNIVSQEDDRGEDYRQFKIQKAEKLLDLVEEKVPGFRDCIQSYYVATPLTYRDYIGTKDGSLYGIKKDYRDPVRTFISPRTKIPNLFITGQNLHMHGVYGVTVGAVKTCSEILGQSYLLQKIKAS